MLRRFIAAVLIVLSAAASVYASIDATATELLSSDIPVVYGDEQFRERILERTKGERDPVGLVLTGGSARALSHLGVLQYLEENGIVPDFIVSNSMGSIIALMYAAGMSPEQIIGLLESTELSELFTFTLPLKGGLLIPQGFETLLEMIIGPDTKLEDLDIPVMVVCDDLVTKREIRITEGDFTDILLASFALPVYFSPHEYRGHLLIDGGVVSLLPLDAAYEYTDTVIVSTAFYDIPSLDLRNAVTILNRAFDIGKNQRAAASIREHKDFIWIRCAVEQFSFMDFGSGREMAVIGYRSAVSAADELAAIESGTVPSSFAAMRDLYSSRIEEAERALDFFSRVEVSSPSFTLGVSFDSNQGKSYRKYLSDTADLMVNAEYRIPGFELRFGLGGAFDFTTHAVAGAYPLAKASMAYYPMDSMRLTLETAATLCHSPWYIPNLYARQGFDWVILREKDSYSLSFKEALEHTTDFQGHDALALSGIFDSDVRIGWFHLYGSAGYLMTADSIAFTDPRNFLQLSFSSRFYLPPAETWFIDAGAFTRFTIDGRGEVPLFLSDGYASTMIGKDSYYDRSSRYHNTMLSLSIGYDFPQAPTFGEFLILEDSEIAAYCDIIFKDTVHVYVSTGIELQTAFSIIGLLEIPLRVRLGYDSWANGFASSFMLTLKY